MLLECLKAGLVSLFLALTMTRNPGQKQIPRTVNLLSLQNISRGALAMLDELTCRGQQVHQEAC